ncbi:MULTISPECIES: energy transducer TonB [unclassified Sphingomonas]|uniref:energy transducer TonB n=1 Tax=unclassified Sphingomonas TaxID=196159 RepID=UPI00215146BB|nr:MULTISPECIES: energy transducer TonB [unclassified Sphingomonas]MCR5869640.1 energy transducer TonB [Sphingomonas sp. J344]UUX98647.1 energy transducer TonB [Sphingomonas sp. J315]
MLTLLVAVAQTATLQAPSSARAYRPHLVDFDAGEAHCDGRSVAVLRAVQPFTEVARLGAAPPRAVRMTFALDRDGRPAGITQRVEDSAPPFGFTPTADLAPALSLWRFAGGRPGTSCSIVFTPRIKPVDEAEKSDLFRVIALRRPVMGDQAALATRLRKIDCGGQRPPQVLLRAYPDKSRIAREPGAPAYSIVEFDIDPAGVPAHVAIATSSGNAGLDRAAVDAAGRSRFAGNAPRTRCTVPVLLGPGDPIPAPPAPDRSAFRPQDSTCPDKLTWTRPIALNYPDGFRRRAIEGWAMLSFDLAPWGEPGQIKVLASEPAEAFGAQARQSLATARANAPSGGAQGCVLKVTFRMPARVDDYAVEGADGDF